jgi:hypothetical protein
MWIKAGEKIFTGREKPAPERHDKSYFFHVSPIFFSVNAVCFIVLPLSQSITQPS